MKHLLITIAVVVLVGCGGSVDINKAATKGDIAAIKQYLNAGNDVDARNESEWTVLMYAAHNGRKEIAELLIAKGADVNFKDESGHTPLYAAAIGGHREIAELLIAKGADVNAKDSIGMTALDWAIDDYPEIADLLQKHGGKTGEKFDTAEQVSKAEAKDISIHDAAKEGNIEAVKQHLDVGVNVNAKHGIPKWTPLHLASLFNRKEVAELLIAKGADVNAKDNYRGTPLHLASLHGCKEVAELLIAKGAIVNAMNGEESTPLDNAEIGLETDPNSITIKETADLLRKHGGKTSEELKAEGK